MDELRNWGYVQTEIQAWGVSGDKYHDRATFWDTERNGREGMWVGEAFGACNTCGCPEYEHVPGQRHFSVTLAVDGETADATDARMACEAFT